MVRMGRDELLSDGMGSNSSNSKSERKAEQGNDYASPVVAACKFPLPDRPNTANI